MILTKTPYRVSFFGGGSDYEGWFRTHGGVALSTSIDQYCHVLLRHPPSFATSAYRVNWAKVEEVNAVADIEHSGVRGCLQYLDIEGGVEVTHAGDLPARTGLGSSSAFTVGMLHALHVLEGRLVTHRLLAEQAIIVEQQVLKETVGIQDQIACSHGGFNLIEIARDGSWTVQPIPMTGSIRTALQSRLWMYYTGRQRYSSEVAEEQVAKGTAKDMASIVGLVPVALDALSRGELDRFGNLLHHTWMIKRGLGDKVSTPEIDAAYDSAISAGALGGKVMGAGSGGFMVFYVPEKATGAVMEALPGIIPLRFEKGGSQVVMA